MSAPRGSTVGRTLTHTEVLALPVTVDLEPAGRAFGLSYNLALELANRGEFPCRVMRVGRRWKVPRAGLLESLGISDQAAGDPV